MWTFGRSCASWRKLQSTTHPTRVADRAGRESGALGSTNGVGICHSYTPDGRCVSLLKLLLTNYCIYDCSYCVNQISSDTQRARVTPEEVVFLTTEFYKLNYIEGLFLSSGIIQSPDYTMEQMVRVASLLRTEQVLGGYIHLKAVPGASEDLLLEAGKWAGRLSSGEIITFHFQSGKSQDQGNEAEMPVRHWATLPEAQMIPICWPQRTIG